MDFKLNLNAAGRPTVNTDALTIAEGRERAISLANMGRSAASGASKVASGAAASAGRSAMRGASGAASYVGRSAMNAAIAAPGQARDAGKAAYLSGKVGVETLSKYKQKWHDWLYSNQENTNLFLLVTNLLYIGLTLAILVLTLLVVDEHVADLKRNEFSQHLDANGATKVYKPCGVPTPDAMYLLQAVGAVPASGYDGAMLEPDYQEWMNSVNRALCTTVVPGSELPSTSCNADTVSGYDNINGVEELLAFGYLIGDGSFTPTKADLDAINSNTTIEAKVETFERLACLENKNGAGEAPFYSKHLRESYGDLKTRVARAYIAAMPAFALYEHRKGGLPLDGKKNPFGGQSDCKHSCHIKNELQSAASDQHYMHNADFSKKVETPFHKQLYRLLALSLAGYVDRKENNGKSFLNTGDDDPLDFCNEFMSNSSEMVTGKFAMNNYSDQDQNIVTVSQCGTGIRSADPLFVRNHGDDEKRVATHTCAATLQYGLFEQGRLFGIPDVIRPFVVDQRVDRNLHFIAKWIYDAMYTEPLKQAKELMSDPKANLELYIAYRLSSTSIWAILVANVAGYMIVRALAPTAIWVLKMVGITTTKVLVKATESYPIIYEEIQLVRPVLGLPVFLTQVVNVLAIYWILWLDPATQSHYYVTPTCEDWQGLGVHVPSGAFGTTWGKRRFSRFGEHLIGTLMGLTLGLVLLTYAIGRSFVSATVVKEKEKVDEGVTARLDKVALVMISFALVIQILFITQSIVTGDAWWEAVKASDRDPKLLETFTKDVQMSIWAAFWTSVSISLYRQKWAISNLNFLIQGAWMAACLLLVWMPALQSQVLLKKELEVAFSDGKGTADTRRLIVYIFIYAFSAIWTLVLGIRLKAAYDAIPERAAALALSASRLSAAKKQRRQFIEGAEAAAYEIARNADAEAALRAGGLTFAPAAPFKFNLASVYIAPTGSSVFPKRDTDSGYMPLMPRN